MSSDSLSLAQFAKHPVTVATSVTGVLGGVLKLPLLAAVWGSFYATADPLFGALTILSLMSEHIDFVPKDWVLPAMLAVGAVVFYKRFAGWAESTLDSYRSRRGDK